MVIKVTSNLLPVARLAYKLFVTQVDIRIILLLLLQGLEEHNAITIIIAAP